MPSVMLIADAVPKFLYIDLFIIIPIAVTSACLLCVKGALLTPSLLVGRTLPYPRIHPKGPTASLVSKKVLSSIIGQVIITGAVQLWAYFWVRGQTWQVVSLCVSARQRLTATIRYTPPVTNDPDNDDGKLAARNYENSALFLVSCFQYILVAAVFSIGAPYRKPMWTNGACLTRRFE